MSTLVSLVHTVLTPIELVVAAILVSCHRLAGMAGLDPHGGPSWVLAIAGLVIVVRLALVPLFLRQVRGAARLRALRPRLADVDRRHRHRTDPASRQAAQRERLDLMREAGVGPGAGCLPVLAQAPILLAVFWVLNGLGAGRDVGLLTPGLAAQADAAQLVGVPLGATAWGSADPATLLLAGALILVSAAFQWLTQRLVVERQGPGGAGDPAAGVQRTLMYAVPVIVAVTSVHVPVGVLVYWCTTNAWSAAQQLVLTRVG